MNTGFQSGEPSIDDATDVVEAARKLYADNRLREAADLLSPLAKGEHDSVTPGIRVRTLELFGLVLHDLGKVAEAADVLERAALIAPLEDVGRIALATCYAGLGRVDLARELYLQLALSRRLPSHLMLEVAAGLEGIDAPDLAMQVCQWVTDGDESIA